MKFVPNLSRETFKKILESNPMFTYANSNYKNYYEQIFPWVEREIFTLDKPFTQLGFPEQGGVTAYFSPSMTKADLDLAKDFMMQKDINPLNTRCFKKGEKSFEITVGSIDKKEESHEF